MYQYPHEMMTVLIVLTGAGAGGAGVEHSQGPLHSRHHVRLLAALSSCRHRHVSFAGLAATAGCE